MDPHQPLDNLWRRVLDAQQPFVVAVCLQSEPHSAALHIAIEADRVRKHVGGKMDGVLDDGAQHVVASLAKIGVDVELPQLVDVNAYRSL